MKQVAARDVVYFEALGGLSDHGFEVAVREALTECQFFPTIKELLAFGRTAMRAEPEGSVDPEDQERRRQIANGSVKKIVQLATTMFPEQVAKALPVGRVRGLLPVASVAGNPDAAARLEELREQAQAKIRERMKADPAFAAEVERYRREREAETA